MKSQTQSLVKPGEAFGLLGFSSRFFFVRAPHKDPHSLLKIFKKFGKSEWGQIPFHWPTQHVCGKLSQETLQRGNPSLVFIYLSLTSTLCRQHISKAALSTSSLTFCAPIKSRPQDITEGSYCSVPLRYSQATKELFCGHFSLAVPTVPDHTPNPHNTQDVPAALDLITLATAVCW